MSDSDVLHNKTDPRFPAMKLLSMLDLMGASIECEQCGRWQRLDAMTEDNARNSAKAKGWVVNADGKDICRICVGTNS